MTMNITVSFTCFSLSTKLPTVNPTHKYIFVFRKKRKTKHMRHQWLIHVGSYIYFVVDQFVARYSQLAWHLLSLFKHYPSYMIIVTLDMYGSLFVFLHHLCYLHHMIPIFVHINLHIIPPIVFCHIYFLQ
jgi:hypothetical protein